ncbi:MAG: hypothetical protein OEV48_04260 [Acidobacteriota bacterium]|nr:hypothetical protein [Acidobacteriota bacterium]
MTETDGIVIEGYEPGPVERYGRRLKMEYIGMASVFVVIAVIIFWGPPWFRTLEATLGSFFLFLGLKKKNRDHLMCSMLLFGAALLARPAVLYADWALSLMLFGATVFSAERYLEKKPQQVAFLPVILGVWAWLDGIWIVGLAYTAAYILCPRSDRPGATKILIRSVIGGAAVGLIVTAARLLGPGTPDGYWFGARIAPQGWLLPVVAAVIVVVFIVIAFYSRRLIVPHKINPLLFAALALWDIRFTAIFAMVAAVLFSASIFKLSIDSERVRPYIWHAEWHYFYLVTALAIWAIFRG